MQLERSHYLREKKKYLNIQLYRGDDKRCEMNAACDYTNILEALT